MARAATVRTELMDRSSGMLKALPISRRFKESVMSRRPEKETDAGYGICGVGLPGSDLFQAGGGGEAAAQGFP